ncbi:MAG: 16S rRNA processing protein RimM [Campylobacteraceae bacterium]|nr:16S rRNA processing protein RimM [Campylobacteraceae bacterium]
MELLEVAKIGRTVGLKGALKLHNKSDFLSQFKKGAKFYLKDKTILEILSFNKATSQVVFKDFEDINLATTLVNKTIYQDKETTRKTCHLNKDEFFYFDIIGLKVVENNELLGVVDEILEIGGSDLFSIKTDESLVKQGFATSFYIPYLDNFVSEISLESSQILTKNAKAILEES